MDVRLNPLDRGGIRGAALNLSPIANGGQNDVRCSVSAPSQPGLRGYLGKIRMTRICDQTEFAKSEYVARLEPGGYSLHYTDRTHLSPTQKRKLFDIQIEEPPRSNDPNIADLNDADQYFSLTSALDSEFEERDKIIVKDILALSLTRLGLLPPPITAEISHQILELKKASGIILVPDSNSLYNGTLHWLLEVLRRNNVWLMPFVVSLTQIQQLDAQLKTFISKPPQVGNLRKALRSRAFINAGLGLLERNKKRYQIIELDPSLLRYLRPSGNASVDADKGDVLEDRLLIEGLHSILRSTRTRASQVVVTSDVLFSRILEAEGVKNICLPSASLPQEPIPCVRFDALISGFVGSTLRGVLWDLAHSFSCVSLHRNKSAHVELNCYWPGKLPHDWLGEKLSVRNREELAPPTSIDNNTRQHGAASEKPAARRNPSKPSEKEESKTTDISSGAIVPQVSLPQVLRLAASVYTLGKGSLPQILEGMPQAQRLPEGIAKRAIAILARANLVDIREGEISGTPRLDAFDSSLREENLDAASDALTGFRPYGEILSALKSRGILQKGEIHSILTEKLGNPIGKEASERLLRYLVQLGQAWTDAGASCDGSQRPTDAEFVAQFAKSFDATARDNLARVVDFMPELCRSSKMSPWSVNRIIARVAREKLTPYSFQPAAGGKPSAVDSIVSGSLAEIQEKPVPIDRIVLNGRPILTIGRSAQ